MSTEKIYLTLLAPKVSEKAARIQTENNQYTFQVATTATKADVKTAVEAMFKVKVTSVQVANIKGKTKAFRGRLGQRQGFRKAYITLAEGQTIELGAKA
jgi:large subunit ribosomal protein L23